MPFISNNRNDSVNNNNNNNNYTNNNRYRNNNNNSNNNKYHNNNYDSEYNNNRNNYNKNNNYDSEHNNNRNNYNKNNINDDNQKINMIKSYLLDYLYNKIEVGEHKYTIIKNIGDVYDLKSKKYYLSANSCGINSILIFLKKDGEHYSYLIDRRSISYNRQSLNKSTVRITEIKLSVDLKLYDGTILDGIMIDSDSNIIGSSNANSNKINFMVTDIFMLGGKSLITMDYKKKMYQGMLLLENLISNTDKKNNIELFISRPFELNEIKELFNDYIRDNIKNYNIKGITFYPQYSGTKLIYIFDKQDDKTKSDLIDGSLEIKEFGENSNENEESFEYSDKKRIFKFELVNPECIDDIVLNLEMKKTNIHDVYKLFGIFSNKNTFIKKRIGFAYIPTYILSIKCKLYFLNRDSIIMSCLFNTNKNKWVPIDEAEVQQIDILNEEKRIKIIEQEIEIDNDNGNGNGNGNGNENEY